MALNIDKPIYDDRVNEIIEGLNQGITREELAERFGHSDYRSLDMYMKRRNFAWDRIEGKYVPKLGEISNIQDTIKIDKPKKIMKLISEGKSLDEVAKLVGLGDITNLGSYMNDKGYKWSSKDKAYVKENNNPVEVTNKVKENNKEFNNKELEPIGNSIASRVQANDSDIGDGISEYVHILDWIKNNKLELESLIDKVETEKGNFPRYKIKGMASVKSIQMTIALQEVVNSYCDEYNMRQKDFFEVAVIECLMKYGYSLEVKTLLNN